MIDYVAIPEERIKILKNDPTWEADLKKFFDGTVEVGEEITIEGADHFMVLRVKEIFKAFGRGFSFKDALNLIDEEYFLETVDVKEYSGKSKKRQSILKGRIIGSEGKIKKQIENSADVKISIYGKTVSIIGKWNNVRIAKAAVDMLLSGSMHTTVQKYLKNKVI